MGALLHMPRGMALPLPTLPADHHACSRGRFVARATSEKTVRPTDGPAPHPAHSAAASETGPKATAYTESTAWASHHIERYMSGMLAAGSNTAAGFYRNTSIRILGSGDRRARYSCAAPSAPAAGTRVRQRTVNDVPGCVGCPVLRGNATGGYHGLKNTTPAGRSLVLSPVVERRPTGIGKQRLRCHFAEPHRYRSGITPLHRDYRTWALSGRCRRQPRANP